MVLYAWQVAKGRYDLVAHQVLEMGAGIAYCGARAKGNLWEPKPQDRGVRNCLTCLAAVDEAEDRQE
jgi:hypothetical protein